MSFKSTMELCLVMYLKSFGDFNVMLPSSGIGNAAAFSARYPNQRLCLKCELLHDFVLCTPMTSTPHSFAAACSSKDAQWRQPFERRKKHSHTIGTIGILIAVFFIANSLYNLHPVPIGFHFICHDEGRLVRIPVPISDR